MNPEQNIQTDKEVLVKVEGLSKKFCKDLKTSLWYGVKDLMTGIGGSTNERMLRPKEFWAVKDINFELRRGECLGLIGHNGAGKSTLLKILNGLINPDAGKVTIKGRVGALIELGAGFNPILSGRENIYNNGAILGFTRQEIDQKLEEIIDFAEIREFIDMPVQHYSSGMKVRLGFAVAAQMEPDVLIIDEVLAVGDANFRAKCFNIIEEILKRCAVIIVSHSMPQIARICSDLILMKNGEILITDKNNTGKAIEGYYNIVQSSEKKEIGSGLVKINSVAINDIEKQNIELEYYKPISIKIKLSSYSKEILNVSLRITFFDVEQKPVAQISSINDSKQIVISQNKVELCIDLDNLLLNTGKYTVHIAIHEVKNKVLEGKILHIVRTALTFNVIGNTFYSHSPCLIKGNWKNNKF